MEIWCKTQSETIEGTSPQKTPLLFPIGGHSSEVLVDEKEGFVKGPDIWNQVGLRPECVCNVNATHVWISQAQFEKARVDFR